VDASGCVTTWNASAERTFGWIEAEVLDLPLPTVPEGKRAQCHEHIAATMAGKPLLDVPVIAQRRNGSSIDVTLSSAPVYDDRGDPIGAILVYVDRAGRIFRGGLEGEKPAHMAITGTSFVVGVQGHCSDATELHG
jgi:PAS domain S-box-containing protein